MRGTMHPLEIFVHLLNHEDRAMEYVIAAVVLGGFALFIYSRVRKSKKSSTTVGSGGGGGRTEPGNTQLK